MKFTAKYIGKGYVEYYRTVFADSINDATKQAEKYVNKSYILCKVTEVFG